MHKHTNKLNYKILSHTYLYLDTSILKEMIHLLKTYLTLKLQNKLKNLSSLILIASQTIEIFSSKTILLLMIDDQFDDIRKWSDAFFAARSIKNLMTSSFSKWLSRSSWNILIFRSLDITLIDGKNWWTFTWFFCINNRYREKFHFDFFCHPY